VGRNRDQPWSYRYYEITLPRPAWLGRKLIPVAGDPFETSLELLEAVKRRRA
jgi:hypothetical protein